MGQLKPVNVFRYSLSLGLGGAAATQALEPPSGEGRDTAAPVTLMGVKWPEPLTMDAFTSKLHIKKQKFVERMATAAAHITPLPKKIKIKYIKKFNY